MSLVKLREDWDELGKLDPLYAIFSDPRKKFGKWNVEEFFQSGGKDIEELILPRIRALGRPQERRCALDFGCGVGRLTRALSKHFIECYGVDISQPMIEGAKAFNGHIPNCHFLVNVADNLQIFKDGQFDFIYSRSVLQHIPNRQVIKSYIAEFMRILKRDGLLAFHLPYHIPLIHRLQPRRKLYGVLKQLGFNEKVLYERLRLTPISMNFIPEGEMIAYVEQLGGKVLDRERKDKGRIHSCIYFVTK